MPVELFTAWLAQAEMTTPPSLNCTVPPAGAGVTVAV
jgi:hypothetical protein